MEPRRRAALIILVSMVIGILTTVASYHVSRYNRIQKEMVEALRDCPCAKKQ